MKSGSKRMHGFLCQSNASTAVCVPIDPRSVIVPRRPQYRTLNTDVVEEPQSARLLDDFNKYSRLVQPRIRRSSDIGQEKNKRSSSSLQVISTTSNSSSTTCNKAVVEAVAPPPNPKLPTHGDLFQVVVMRVSIHCQGCAGKVRKHISKMEGVTSFNIDLDSKRVTVMGHISPLGVLQSISKVKKAEFWHNNK